MKKLPPLVGAESFERLVAERDQLKGHVTYLKSCIRGCAHIIEEKYNDHRMARAVRKMLDEEVMGVGQ